MGKSWVEENQKRQEYLDWLYELDQRDLPSDHRHATYTDLIKERKQLLIERDRRAFFGEES